ncbi:MAG: hypothetical protein IKY61_08240, partial [Thermoguttaceae bacterium]|nr:hypothetical protein [Thermoguttaceae bacterium]
VRFSFRKPNRPNAPRALTGWRKLEAEFAPSTLRDEIALTRLQIEYYDAPDGEKSDAAHKILVDWLQNRPEPQRDVMSATLLENRDYLRKTPLQKKSATLCDALTSISESATASTDDAQ